MIAGQAVAADLPYYPPVIEIPDVDYGYSGSFYLRGSAGRGVLTVELETIDEHTERLGAGRLALEDGTVVELTGGD